MSEAGNGRRIVFVYLMSFVVIGGMLVSYAVHW